MSDEIRVTIYQPKRIPNVYRPPMGFPLNWKDETSGELPHAVFRFFGSHQLSPEEISLIAEYCQHYINAPCWDATGGFPAELASLRQSANSISSVSGINQWIDGCLQIAIDPF
ncbi:hypothetical protein CDG76_30675 [Nostoc sp. 'Peltigera membranacea cyanobiont' 210A]|uniref:hypothetical protein n=1 Tax=Nostoc sp. 'Peltigera membranacea cyanobiont' 210A TaxID=2014529 RepID=UPI000B95BE2D|nr:hypothetical protein [Nostoc sp. 'Peltigera membranacea cyanobiont' 210A]OYD90591.1 hypothetical protein CDG76_30675 [Nostoc sp. 'Peltigera membranacea cyanobiont' 210A]